MIQEIYQQPQVVQKCLERYDTLTLPLDSIEQIQILGCGTSLNASFIGQYWLEQLAGIPTRVRSSSEFLLAPLKQNSNTFTIAVTQSGETADTLAAIAQISSPKLAITNGWDSTITKQVEHTLYLDAGIEKSVAATKTFTAQLAVFYSLVLMLTKSNKLKDWLRQLPAQMETMLQREHQMINIAQSLKETGNLIILGSGIHYPIALEGALKLKEATYTHAEGYAAGEFLHGPIALLDEHIPTIALISKGESGNQVLKTVDQIQAKGGTVIPIYTPPMPEVLTPFLMVIPLQLLAYHLAIVRGIEVDRPRNITKFLGN
jgi:glucosamine--fructose-6-phosphate aminotransferase (isomerizing)